MSCTYLSRYSISSRAQSISSSFFQPNSFSASLCVHVLGVCQSQLTSNNCIACSGTECACRTGMTSLTLTTTAHVLDFKTTRCHRYRRQILCRRLSAHQYLFFEATKTSISHSKSRRKIDWKTTNRSLSAILIHFISSKDLYTQNSP